MISSDIHIRTGLAILYTVGTDIVRHAWAIAFSLSTAAGITGPLDLSLLVGALFTGVRWGLLQSDHRRAGHRLLGYGVRVANIYDIGRIDI
jgi:hypothetical protein